MLVPYKLIARSFYFSFYIATPTTEIYTLPYTTLFRSGVMVAEYTPVGSTTPVTSSQAVLQPRTRQAEHYGGQQGTTIDRKSTRLNSSHSQISYAVFCLKKKKISYMLSDASRHEEHSST